MRDFLSSLIHSPKDWVIAGIMAFIIFAIFDLLPIGDSRIRSLVRFVRNKISEQSVSRLQKRIEELERYRDTLASYNSSDKIHYLATLRTIMGILLCICVAMFVLVLDRLGLLPTEVSRGYAFMGLMPLALGIVLGILGIRLASIDTALKISETIAKVDGEIATLKSKLPAHSPQDPAGTAGTTI